MADVSGILAAGKVPQPENNFLQQYGQLQNILNAQETNKLLQIEQQQKTTDLNTQRMNRQAQVAYGLSNLSDDELQGGQAVRDAIDAELKSGTIDRNTHDVFLSNLPAATDANGNPTSASTWRKVINSHLIGTLAGPEAIKAVQGTPYVMNNGQQLQPGMVGGALSANPGQFTPSGAPTQVYPSRTELLGQTEEFDTDPNSPTYGQKIPKSLAQRAQSQGAGNLVGPAGGGGTAQPSGATTQTGPAPNSGGAASPPPPKGNQPPPSPQNPPRLNPANPPQGPAGQPQAGNGPARGPVTSMPPGSDEEFKASSGQYAADNTAAGGFRTRMQPLLAANDLLKDVSTGKGVEGETAIKGWIVAHAPEWMKSIGLTPDQVYNAKSDMLAKYLQQIVNTNPLAGGSDARLAAAITGNPSMHINQLAAQDVVKTMIGLERMKQAAITEFNQKYGPGNGFRYSRFMQEYQNSHDPRAFIVDLLDKPQRDAMVKSMKPAELQQFNKTYATAKSMPDVMSGGSVPVVGQ